MSKKIILVDLDSTVARKGSRHYYQWESVNSDTPITEVITLVHNYPAKIVILTGRNAGYKASSKMLAKFPNLDVEEIENIGRTETEKWVAEHIGEVEKIIMKPAGSYQKSAEFKVDEYLKLVEDGYDVDFIIDDNESVVEAFERIGVLVLKVVDSSYFKETDNAFKELFRDNNNARNKERK